MNILETIDLIKELKQNMLHIQNTDSIDDVKEAELYEFEIINAIFQYCLKNNYSTAKFPEKYQDLFESDDEDFQDFLDFNVQSFYVYKIALQQNDVFKMVKLYLKNFQIVYSDQDCKNGILVAIEILKNEGITLSFNRNGLGYIPAFRPKLPE